MGNSHRTTVSHYHTITVAQYHDTTVALYHCTTVPLKHCTTEPLYHLPQYHCSTVSEFYSTTLPEYDSIKVPEYHHIIPHYTTIKEYQSTREPQKVGNSHAHVHNRPKLQRVFSFKTLSHHSDYTDGPSSSFCRDFKHHLCHFIFLPGTYNNGVEIKQYAERHKQIQTFSGCFSKYSSEKMKFVDKKNCVICRLEVCRRKELVDHIDLSVIVTQPLEHQRILIITIKNIIVLTGSLDKSIPE